MNAERKPEQLIPSALLGNAERSPRSASPSVRRVPCATTADAGAVEISDCQVGLDGPAQFIEAWREEEVVTALNEEMHHA
jgi:hypothetical protein